MAEAEPEDAQGEGNDVDMDQAPSESDEDVIDIVCFKDGDTVRIDGLKAAAHLNGKSGTLDRFDPKLERWNVKMPNGELKAIKADNLTLVETSTMDVDSTQGPDDYSNID